MEMDRFKAVVKDEASRGAKAALVLALWSVGWIWESHAGGERMEVGKFSASFKPDFRTNDAWGMHLRSGQLMVGEVGEYSARILHGEKVLASQTFQVKDGEPVLIDFNDITPLGGIGGVLRGEGYNPGWGNFPGEFRLELSRSAPDGSEVTQTMAF